MSVLISGIVLFLLANLIVALVVSARGTTPADRMLVALLFGTAGTAVLALLAMDGGGTALLDAALVLALLAAISGVAFAKLAWRENVNEHH